jgi:hypothetical protein
MHTIYGSDGIRAGSKGLENTYMENTRNECKNSGQALLPGLQRSKSPSMAGHHHEEDDMEDPEVRLS